MQFFEVGGCVRDELLGVKSKDIDYTVVLGENDWHEGDDITPFECMYLTLQINGFEIFLSTPEFLTVRARFPKGHKNSGITADFVLARKESDYTDGRRPDKVEPGTLMDDLRRRDFTMNAIAKDSEGNLIDPFNGQWDIEHRIIRAVGDPAERFEEDALRIMRALRFKVTKGFSIEYDTQKCMVGYMETLAGVSPERVREELTKMFNADPMETIYTLDVFAVFPIIFDMGINFQPTMKARVK
jgi:tRNA nucleotidyltransferase/poly(A) polymerase